MSEVPIDVGYRSYIRLQRKKWDIVYHSKDLYFSHANKTLDPFYDMYTKEFYGVETNPTRLAIVKLIDQFREGPGQYDLEPRDLPKSLSAAGARNRNEVKVRNPFRSGRHQSSHPSLTDALREEHYIFQDVQPAVQELPKKHPYQYSLLVEEHPYPKMVGHIWTHIYVPSPVDFSVLDDVSKGTGYRSWLQEACGEGHDVIIVEPIFTQYYIRLMLRVFYWAKLALKVSYAYSIIHCCQRPHRWQRNLALFSISALAHCGLGCWMKVHPLAKYKFPDRFHDSECLNELKYFREFVPSIVHRVLVIFKDVEGLVTKPLKTFNVLHLVNFIVLGYNYLYGMEHWYTFHPVA